MSTGPVERDDVRATNRNLARLRQAANERPSKAKLEALREEVQRAREEADVKIVELDGPMSIWVWLCKTHRENLKPGWFVKQVKEPPHMLVCDKCERARSK
jgi:hypothetical protein